MVSEKPLFSHHTWVVLQSILVCQFLSFSNMDMSYHSLLLAWVSAEKFDKTIYRYLCKSLPHFTACALASSLFFIYHGLYANSTVICLVIGSFGFRNLDFSLLCGQLCFLKVLSYYLLLVSFQKCCLWCLGAVWWSKPGYLHAERVLSPSSCLSSPTQL